jgi:hypothetical protein
MKYQQGIFLLLSMTILLGAPIARADPCASGIARLGAELRAASANPALGPSGRQTVGAQLGHQPTPASVARAEASARARLAAALARAKALDARGKRAACAKIVKRARLMLDAD